MGETIINGIIEVSQEVVGQLQYAAGDVIKNIDQTYSPTSENAQSGKAVAEALKAERTYANNNFANVLKGSASGEAVRLTDVSPIEHTLKVRLLRKNLFDTVNAVKLNGRSSFLVTNNKIMASQSTTQSYQSANVLIPQSLIGKNITLSAKSNTSGANVAALRIQWVSNSGVAAGDMILGNPDSTGNIVVTGTVPTQPDEAHNNLCLMFYSNVTGTLETGTTYTATYSDIQIELGSTATSYAPYISDFSGVTLKRYGKNLLPYPYKNPNIDYTANGINYKVKSDGTVVANGTATAQSYFILAEPIVLNKGVYYLSGCPSGGQGSTYSIYFQHDNFSYYKVDYGSGVKIDINEKKNCAVAINIGKNTTVSNLIFKPMLEVGSKLTDFEERRTAVAYTPAADGTISGVKSLYPTTTLMTDTEGVIIEAEYNRDINKAFAALEAAIATNNS